MPFDMNEGSTPSDSKRPGRFFYGWWIVAAASLQGMFGNGAISSGFPRFFQPIRQDLGISYASMSLVFGLARAEGGMGGPIVGWLVDKFGSRPMILFGGLIAGVGLVLLSRADSYWELVVIFVGVISVGKTAGLGQTLMASVNQWFVRRKAVALSTLMTAFAGGGAIVLPLLHLGIVNLGWRATVMSAGIFVIALTIPTAWIIRSKPEDVGMLPDGDPPRLPTGGERGTERAVSSADPEFTVRQAVRTVSFWLILMGVITRVSATNAVIIHLFPMLEWKGVDEQTATIYASVMFFLAIPLRFLLGVAGGRFSAPKLLFVGMNLGAVGLLGLWVVPGTLGIAIFILGLAVVEGITSVNWIMVGEYFGRARFASLMGFMSVFHNVGLLIAPIFSGWVRDQTGSYSLVLMTFVPLFVASAFLFAVARRPTMPAAPEELAATTQARGGR